MDKSHEPRLPIHKLEHPKPGPDAGLEPPPELLQVICVHDVGRDVLGQIPYDGVVGECGEGDGGESGAVRYCGGVD